MDQAHLNDFDKRVRSREPGLSNTRLAHSVPPSDPSLHRRDIIVVVVVGRSKVKHHLEHTSTISAHTDIVGIYLDSGINKCFNYIRLLTDYIFNS